MHTVGADATPGWGHTLLLPHPPRMAPEGAEGAEGMRDSRFTVVHREPKTQTAWAPGPTVS